MTGNSPSTDRLAPDEQLCVWCKQPRESHTPSCPSPPAFLDEKVVVRSLVYKVVPVPGTPPPPLLGVGSSSTVRGGRASRSWSVTGSSGSVSRRLRRARSVAIWESVRSQRGMATGKTSDSSKSSIVEDDTIGPEDPTPASWPKADCDKGWEGNHLWGYVTTEGPGSLFCFNCGRRK